MAQERNQPPAVVLHQERLPVSLMQGIPIGKHPGQGLLPAPGLTPDRVIRKAARLHAVREMRAAAPALIAREQGLRPTARHTEHTLAARHHEREAAGRRRDLPLGRQVPGLTPGATREAAIPLAVREKRAAAPVPIAREQDPHPNAQQRDHSPAAQRQEREAAGPQPAPGLTPGRAIREAVHPLAEEEMMAAAPVPQAPVPVPIVRE